MKFNKWTLGLAAVGVVSLASAAKAEEKTANSVLTALSSTTLSGYVDTSAQWNFNTSSSKNGNFTQNTPPYAYSAGKQDGFNLNAVVLTLQKPLDESEWASGYRVDLAFGPDAGYGGLNTSSSGYSGSDFSIQQAYVELRTPVGNGIDWKMGVFNTIIGYEVFADGDNPNYTRSWGYSIEPTTHTGLLASYRFSDSVTASVGIANTFGPTINQKPWQGNFNAPPNTTHAESYKTYMGSIALTAPSDWGFLSGSTLYGGIINGWNGNAEGSGAQTSYYAGATVNTPVTGLKAGIAYDLAEQYHFNDPDAAPGANGRSWALGLYATYQATEKLSLNLRGEYFSDKADRFEEGNIGPGLSWAQYQDWALTTTVQYDLWKNVISRLEFRYDNQCLSLRNASGGGAGGGGPFNPNAKALRNNFMLAANIIYKF